MINTDQLHRMLDNDMANADGELYALTIDFATMPHDELLRICTDADALESYAWATNYSPATICRIAQYLTDSDNFIQFCTDYEFCPIHRCDPEICRDDNLHPYSN